MNKILKTFGILGISVLLIAIIGTFAFNSILPVNTAITGAGIEKKGEVCFWKNLGKPNQEDIGCFHNAVYNAGREAIEQALALGSQNNFTVIALCNATATNKCENVGASADGTEAFTAFDGCGLDNTTGKYYDLGIGNWTIEYTFTTTCAGAELNHSRLQNETMDGYLATVQFSHTTLNNIGDTFHANWSNWIPEDVSA